MIGILTMADMQRRDGNSIRPNLEAEGLMKNGFREFKVFSPNPRPDAPYEQERILVRKVKDQPWPFMKRKLNVDLVHAHQLSGAVLRQSYITDMHGFATMERESMEYSNPVKGFLFPLITKNTELKIIRNAEKVICASKSIKQDVLDYLGDKGLDITVVNNMVKPELYKPTKQKDLVVGLIGPFTNRWGIENLNMLHSMLKSGKANFPVITVGSITEKQIDMFRGFENVRHIGKVSDKDYMKFLRIISVLMLPFPPSCGGGGSKNKLLEAAASSVAVVSTKTGAVGFDGKKLLKMAEKPEGLLEKIKQLENRSVRVKIGKKLRNEIEIKHNYIRETKKLIKIYFELS